MVNAGTAEVTLAVQGREPVADFLVTGPGGQPVWSFLKGQIMRGSLRLLPLAAGKRLRFRQTWGQVTDAGAAVPPGDYLVRATLITDVPGGLSSPSFRLSIVRS